MPTVLVVGEIYVRCDPFANDFIIDKLEQRGVRARFAPFNEWLEYTDILSWWKGEKSTAMDRVRSLVQFSMQRQTYAAMAAELGWPERTTVEKSIEAARGYIRQDLQGEAVLTVGGPIHEWREGIIDGVVSVGPLECMPNKISEAQFFHVAEREGLVSLTLALNGDPVDPETVDNFAFEVRSRFAARSTRHEERESLLERSLRLLAALAQRQPAGPTVVVPPRLVVVEEPVAARSRTDDLPLQALLRRQAGGRDEAEER